MTEKTVKVLDAKSGSVIEVNENFARRLIEQGAAVIPPKGEPESDGKKADAVREDAPAKKPAGKKRR